MGNGPGASFYLYFVSMLRLNRLTMSKCFISSSYFALTPFVSVVSRLCENMTMNPENEG